MSKKTLGRWASRLVGVGFVLAVAVAVAAPTVYQAADLVWW